MDHRYQLSAIELREFKSVRDQRVELGPLTVVVGANSAGKSTLLQAILALAQAVRSEGATSEFPLNGSLIRLGTFNETRNYLAESLDSQIEIKFELLDNSPMRELGVDEPELAAGTATPRGRRELRLVSWHAFVAPVDNDDDPDTESKGGFAEITRLILSVARAPSAASDDVPEPLFECDINPISDPAATEELESLRILNRRLRHGRMAKPLPVDGRIQDLVEGTPPRIDAVILSGGVPCSFLQRTTVFDYLAGVWWSTAEEALLDDQPTLSDNDAVLDDEDQPDRSDILPIAPSEAARHIEGFMTGDDARSTGARAGGAGRWLDSPDRYFLQVLGRLGQDKRSDLARSIRAQGLATFLGALRANLLNLEGIEDEVLLEHSGAAVEVLTRSGAVAQRFFSNSIEYLGPLREAPHALYDPGPTQTDLGPTGKFAAAVLHAQADTRVVMPAIPGSELGRHPRGVPLNQALNGWLQWFGLADEATSEDLGRLGIGLSVTPSALGRPVDLTSVGVGVSQVLPVVLQCLLARPGTLIILEQPELHLHPRLQQDLADFLLACVETGRQLVVETHSEHLVNRLRRRVAADDSDQARNLVKLVFAESADGITTYRESKINPYGGLDDDWPDGFLDLGARESRALIKESASKRRRDSAR